jgi:hypothetical protein
VRHELLSHFGSRQKVSVYITKAHMLCSLFILLSKGVGHHRGRTGHGQCPTQHA